MVVGCWLSVAQARWLGNRQVGASVRLVDNCRLSVVRLGGTSARGDSSIEHVRVHNGSPTTDDGQRATDRNDRNPTTDNRQLTALNNVTVVRPTTDNRQSTTARNVSEPSDVLLPLDRAAAVLGLSHHPVDRTEGQHAGEDHRGQPTDRDQQCVERGLANVAESEEEVAHLGRVLRRGKYRYHPDLPRWGRSNAPERFSRSAAKAGVPASRHLETPPALGGYALSIHTHGAAGCIETCPPCW